MKELLEKLSAMREDLLAWNAQAQAGDAKKLAELVKQKAPIMRPAYEELTPYMTVDQRSGGNKRRDLNTLIPVSRHSRFFDKEPFRPASCIYVFSLIERQYRGGPMLSALRRSNLD